MTSISLVLGSIVSVQSGAAAATTLFDQIGPAGAVLLRTLARRLRAAQEQY